MDQIDKHTMRILVVEDDRKLARLIGSALQQEKMDVDLAHDGDVGLELALRAMYDVAVLDWMLPGRDGLSICRAIRQAHLSTAVLMLTARSQIEDRVVGLNNGADDYLVKPFAFSELIARIYALSRRSFPAVSDPFELRCADIVLDLRAHTARRQEIPLDLTQTEWKLLEYLMRHPNQCLTRQQIVDYVWSYEASVQPTLVDVYVTYLRQKINQNGLSDPIRTIRGAGYRLEVKNA